MAQTTRHFDAGYSWNPTDAWRVSRRMPEHQHQHRCAGWQRQGQDKRVKAPQAPGLKKMPPKHPGACGKARLGRWLGLPGWALLASPSTGCAKQARGLPGVPWLSFAPKHQHLPLLPTSVVSAVNDLTKRGLNGMTNKRYVTAHASAHSKMICNYLISVMQITPSSP